jgi:hypothetical protein
MGRQELSPPRQRHLVPDHRRRHRHHHHHPHPYIHHDPYHHTHYSDAETTNRKFSWHLGRLNREFHAPNSHDVVESWLGQVTASAATRKPVSLEPRDQPVHYRKQPRSQDSNISPCRRHPGLVDPLWGPQHIPPDQGPSSPHLPLTTNRDRKLKRYKRSSDDSSLLSDDNRCQEHWERGRAGSPSEYEESSHYKPLDEAQVGGVSAFEKRPRHKTREDKYETKKPEGRERRRITSGQGEQRPRKSESKRRKHVATGRNVMNNFASEAVLNDRITVCVFIEQHNSPFP